MKVIVMTDISSCQTGRGEPDDTQSLFRLLLYSDQFDILGLIATYTIHLDRAEPALIRQVIEAYAKVQDTLRSAGPFMRAETLASRVYCGSPALVEAQPGGPAADAVSEGARHIVRCVDASQDPVWVLAWGGVYDLAQALYLARREKDAAAFAAFLGKLRIHSVEDQYDGWGPILRAEFPDLFYVISHDAHRGMYRDGNLETAGTAWLRAHIARGPYGGHYPLYDGGDRYSNRLGGVKGLKEGDTPSFLNLIDNGLSVPERPDYGGWGGRYVKLPGTGQYTDAYDTMDGDATPWASVYRWRPDYQADFAARMALSNGERSVLAYPQIRYDGPVTLRPGQLSTLRVDSDPDAVLTWTRYAEAGTYGGPVLLSPEGSSCEVYLPSIVQTGTVHLIVTALGPSGLRRYCRIVLQVEA